MCERPGWAFGGKQGMSHAQRLKKISSTAAKWAGLHQNLAKALPTWVPSGSVGLIHLEPGFFAQGQQCGISSWLNKHPDVKSGDVNRPCIAALCSVPAHDSSDRYVDFRRIEKWEDVQERVKEIGSEITATQIGAAFSCLKKIEAQGTNVPRELLTELSATLIALDKDMDARTVADVLHACGKMKYTNQVLVEHVANLVVTLKTPSIESFDARALATLVHALGSLSHMMGVEMLQTGIIGDLKQQAVTRLSHPEHPVWDGRNAVQIMYGLSLLKINDSALCRKILSTFSDPTVLQETSERELFSLAYSMAALQVNHPDLLAQIVSEVLKEERRAKVKKIGVASIIHSVCRLGFQDFSALGKLVDVAIEKSEESKLSALDLAQMVQALGTRRMFGHSVLVKLGKECSQIKLLRECSDQQLCNIVHGFSKLKHMPTDLAQALSKEVGKLKRLTKFTDQGLANVLYSFSQLKVGDDSFKKKLVTEATKRTRLASSTPQGLSNILLSIRQWRYEGEEYNAVVKEISKQTRLESFDSHTLSSVIYSLSQTNYNNIQVLQCIVSECVKPEKIVTFKAQGISNLIVALSNMGVSDALVWHILTTEATKPSRLTSFTEQGLVQILYALQHVRLKNDYLMAAIGREILVPERLGNYSPESLAGAFVTLATADFSWKWMDNRSKANVLKEISKPTRLRSFSERGLCSILKAMRLMSLKSDSVLSAVVNEVLSEKILPKLHELGLCSIMVSFSKLGIRDPEKYAAVCERLVDKKVLQRLRSRDFATIFDSLYWADGPLPKCMEKALPIISTKEFVQECSENELVMMIRAFRGLGIADMSTTGLYINEVLKPERCSKLTGKQMVTLLEGCLDLGVEAVKPIHKMVEENLHIIQQTGVHHLIQITTRLCQLGREFDGITHKVVKQLKATEKLKKITDIDLKNVIDQLEVVGLSCSTDLDAERQRRKRIGQASDSVGMDYSQGPGDAQGVLIASNSGSILNAS